MDKYLTTKVTPKKITVMMEVIAAIVSCAALLVLLAAVVYVWVKQGVLSVDYLRVLLIALPWLIVLYLVMRRWYDRTRARQIVSLLRASEQGHMTCGELSKAGVYAPAEAIAKLTKRQYIRNVVELHGEVRLVNRDLQQSTKCD